MCSERQYMSKMYNQVFNFIERLRWRASFYKIEKLKEKKYQEEANNIKEMISLQETKHHRTQG